ncbi:hypothetical protein ACWKT3_35755 [Streptomyces violaceus]
MSVGFLPAVAGRARRTDDGAGAPPAVMRGTASRPERAGSGPAALSPTDDQ